MKPQFTPGPWKSFETSLNTTKIKGATRTGECICLLESPYGDDERQANAALIAAAPELFEALESIMGACEGATLPKNMMIHLTDARTKARAALAKAKGELC